MQFGAGGVGCPKREAVLARGLRLVHGPVCTVEELFRSVGSGLEPRHPHGRAEVQSGVAVAEGAGSREEAVGERLHRGALRVGEEDGLAKVRVFATPGDWASSSIVYTLDEMLAPEDMLDPSAISRQ